MTIRDAPLDETNWVEHLTYKALVAFTDIDWRVLHEDEPNANEEVCLAEVQELICPETGAVSSTWRRIDNA